MTPSVRKVYRSDFGQFFWICNLWSSGGVIVSALNRPLSIIIAIILTVVPLVLLFNAAVVWLMVRCFPVYISVQGLRSYNGFGIYSNLAWHECETIKPFSILGLRYLSIQGKHRRKIHIPLYLSKLQHFYEDVKAFAGVDHPLSQALADILD